MINQTIYKSKIGKQRILEYYESYLSTFEVDFERVYVKTRFGKTHTLVAGPVEGKPIFIFQGGNCINPMTLSWFSGLLKEYRIYAPDTVGHPGYSQETRISAKDNSFALWITDLMNHFKVEKAAFIGPSYGAGIILRLAAFLPEKISCSILVSPAGLKLGSKMKMITKILIPLGIYSTCSSTTYLRKITDVMSHGSMKELDQTIIGEIFKSVKLEQDMPKLTEKKELEHYHSPTLIIVGEKDIFFPGKTVAEKAANVFSHPIKCNSYLMGHFPDDKSKYKIEQDIKEFLIHNYE